MQHLQLLTFGELDFITRCLPRRCYDLFNKSLFHNFVVYLLCSESLAWVGGLPIRVEMNRYKDYPWYNHHHHQVSCQHAGRPPREGEWRTPCPAPSPTDGQNTLPCPCKCVQGRLPLRCLSKSWPLLPAVCRVWLMKLGAVHFSMCGVGGSLISDIPVFVVCQGWVLFWRRCHEASVCTPIV